jgi:hypothetical protein
MEWCGGKHIYNIQGGVSDGFAGRGGDASPSNRQDIEKYGKISTLNVQMIALHTMLFMRSYNEVP